LIGSSPRLVARAAAEVPVTWVAFDACYLDGASLLDQPYRVRRAALEDLDLRGPAWAPTPASLGEGLRMLRAARQHELEGVVAKRLSSRYLPGRRSRSWVKVKRFHRATLVVTGWVPWPGRRSGPLALGYFCPVLDGGPSEVRFAGMVETGFSEDDRLALGERLAELQDERAVPWRSHRGQAVYPVPPKLRVEVQLLEWTAQGQARHLSYKGVAGSAP
jgi:bifunctional non-homologous end joining protein LigD